MGFRTHLSAIFIAATTLASPALADKAILVLDGSGSMWGQIDGKNKIVIARETVGTLMAGWPTSTELGLIAYGHREKGDCGDIETLVPVGPDTAPAVEAAVGVLNPKGKTPITAAVRQAAAELRSTEEKATVILVSDGLETCNADPCAAAAELEAAGIDFTVHVVGFGTTAEENQQLQCLADNTGGKFLGASNAAELKTAMVEVKEVVAEPTETVIKIDANVGWIELANADGGLEILTQSGDKVGKITCVNCSGNPAQVSAGTYRVKGTGFEVAELAVAPGETAIVDAAAMVGWIELANADGGLEILTQSGDKVGKITCVNCSGNPAQVSAGTYRVKGTGFEVAELVVDPGETAIVDAAAMVGWIELANADGGLEILTQSGDKVGKITCVNCSGNPAQVSAGTYRVKGTGFEVKDVVVKAGEKVVIDVGG